VAEEHDAGEGDGDFAAAYTGGGECGGRACAVRPVLEGIASDPAANRCYADRRDPIVEVRGLTVHALPPHSPPPVLA